MTLDLKELFRIIKKRIWLMVIITVLTTAASFVISFFLIDPTYEAKSTIIIGKVLEEDTKVQYNDVLMYQKLSKTYGEIAKSRLVSDKAVGKLGMNLTTERLMKKITVTPQTDTQIMIISAKDINPEAAKNIANTVSDVFIEEAMRIYPTGSVQVMDYAPIPKNPVSPNKKLNVAIAFILGLMISFGIIFLQEYLDNTIKTEEDVEKYLGLPVIGIIPQNDEQ